jgi:hypothetical protein
VANGQQKSQPVEFTRDVRPILSEMCFQCHGPDAKKREAELRLDTKDGAHAVLKPSDSAASELIKRITSTDPDESMPPPDAKRTLTAEQVGVLKKWIDQGAEWGEHWAFTPIEKPPVPAGTKTTKDGVYVRNPIDNFVQTLLKQRGLTPAAEASKLVLIRRLSLDLTGLPATPAEIDQFVNDKSPDAYEKLVDRFLQSSAYGERMAWNWLDAARYADSNGYQGDRERTMWPWRDWVVDSFNDNLPFDQFTVWQLAGDLLPNATVDQKLATAFCRNHMINGEGGRIAEENRVDYVMDMSETMGTVWLGLTLNCCRCHDHKFDKLKQREYYQFNDFFNQTPVNGGGGDPHTAPVMSVPGKGVKSKLQPLEQRLAETETRLEHRSNQLLSLQAAWEATRRKTQPKRIWETLKPDLLKAEHQDLKLLDDLSVLASGENPANDSYTLKAASPLRQITAVRLDAVRHESMTEGGLARSDSGNFVLTEFALQLEVPGKDPQQLKLSAGDVTFEQGNLKLAAALDGNPKNGWAVHEGRVVDRDHAGVFLFEKPVDVPEKAKLIFTMRHDSAHASHNIGRFRLSVSNAPQPKLEKGQEKLDVALAVSPDKRSKEQKAEISKAHRQTDKVFRDTELVAKKLQQEVDGLRKSFTRVMVMADMSKRRETFMLERGLYSKRGETVVADVPAFLPPLPKDAPRNRLTLANWLVSNENPLTARVTVNRFWQQLFGIGLVKTAEDFGVQGEAPQHLDLLNWLASDFREHQWDVKRFVKQVVMSHAYRQSSKHRPELTAADPENRLLGRSARYRLPAWMIRDQALAASGLLVRTEGGPGVNGYQPSGVWEETTFGRKKYNQQHGDALYRRSIYTFWRRIVAPTMFFDNASRQTCTVQVLRTNTPLHALYTLNDVTFVEAGRALAQLALQSGGDDDQQRLNYVYKRLLGRAPSEREKQILLAALERTRGEFAAEKESASQLLAVGESARDEKLDVVEHASWTSLCLALFNLDEALSKQ